MDWSSIAADFQRNWWIYASMPVMAAVIGYVTKLLAIHMMFKPLEFRGIPPYLGWQGMLPRRAGKMAAIAYDTLTRNLLDIQELVDKIDPDEFVREIREPLNRVVEELTESLLAEYQPDLWESLPDPARRLLIRRLQARAPGIVRELFEQVTRDIHEVVDVRHLVISNLARDGELTSRMIRDIATPELRFLIRSGIYFGTVIGLVQLVVWALTRNPLVMPVFGLLTGWVTDYLALNMLFVPAQPRKVLGVTIHGLFLRRQHEVSSTYGSLIARWTSTTPSRRRCASSPPSQFVQILRPAFKEDEKTAIAVGALLGAAVGELQAFLVIHLPALLGG
jgi:uncharacterized membrane protein YheB (UPF0754 family)